MAPVTLISVDTDVMGLEEIIIVLLTHRPASLERSVHLEVERTEGEIRPVSSVLLENSRQRLVRPPLFI